MRISDWSSDVCSSDLLALLALLLLRIRRLRRACPLAASLPDRGVRPRYRHGGRARRHLHHSGECFPPLWRQAVRPLRRSEEHTSELQSLMRISYAVFCLKKKNTNKTNATKY